MMFLFYEVPGSYYMHFIHKIFHSRLGEEKKILLLFSFCTDVMIFVLRICGHVTEPILLWNVVRHWLQDKPESGMIQFCAEHLPSFNEILHSFDFQTYNSSRALQVS